MTSQRETITSIIGATMSGTKLSDNTITTSDDSELTLPTGGGELVTKDGAQTLTNKIYKATVVKSYNNQNYEGIQIERKDHPYNFKAYVPIIGNSVNNPVYLVAADSVATLTNKTLTAPVINNPTITNSNSNTITLPTSGGTLATTAITDDLANRINGMNPAQVFDTKAAMDTWLANSANTATLTTGTNLYIRATDVPDYWWDGTQAQKLETEKVDLTNIYTKAETNALIPTDYVSTGTPVLATNTITYNTDKIVTLPTNGGTLATTSDLSSYALTSHNHDSVYAAKSHTHNYATSNHNHDSTYAPINHTHSGYAASDHNHDSIYALASHTHNYDNVYAAKNHTHDYAASNHNHDSIYALASHTHSQYLTAHQSLDAYAKKAAPEITNPTLKDNSTNYTLKVSTLTANTTIATAKDLEGYSKTNHTHNYAASNHNHDTAYAPKSHTHDYAASNHNHDSAYAAKSHTHDYAASTHNHDSVYAKLSAPTITNPTLKDSTTTYTLTVPTLTANTTIATAKDLTGYSTTSHTHSQYLTAHQSLNGCVKTTGDQEIDGNKTFKKAPRFVTETIYVGALGAYQGQLTIPHTVGTLATTADLGAYALANHTHSGMVTETGSQTLTNKTLTAPTLKDSSTSYTLTVPTLTANTTIATAKDISTCVKNTGNETIAGVKTFSSAPKLSTNTITNSSSKTITLPSAAGTLATIAGTETLTNKTLTTPIIATIKNTNNITVPTVGGTMLTTSHVLVSKTLNTSSTNVVETPANDYKTWFYVSYNTITKEFHCDFRVKNSSATSNHYPLNTWQTIGTCTAVKPAVTVYGLYEYNKNVNTNGEGQGHHIFLRYTNEGAIQVYNSTMSGWGAVATEAFHGSIHAVAI